MAIGGQVDFKVTPEILNAKAGEVTTDIDKMTNDFEAAASIVAKVERDHLMEMYDEIYPEYGFASNKGYGSKEHMEALRKYGPCPIHRRSFIKGIV